MAGTGYWSSPRQASDWMGTGGRKITKPGPVVAVGDADRVVGMDTAASAICRKRGLEQTVAVGANEASLGWLVVALTFGAIGTLAGSVSLLFVMSLGWFLVASRGPRLARQNGLVALRLAVVGACAWAATMFGVVAVAVAGPDARAAVASHPAFGEHPVLVRVGFPWPGIEGNGMGLAGDRIPFSMGIDALLVNFAVFALLFAYWLRRAPREQLIHLLPPAAIAAGVCGLAGSWRLLVLFD